MGRNKAGEGGGAGAMGGRIESGGSSSSSSIGLVYIDLNPLLMRTANYDEEDDDDDNRGSVDKKDGGIGSSVGNEDTGRGSTGSGKGAGIIDGWFPLYDTMGGVRGELCLSVKLNYIGDKNPFRDSSAGVQLFPFSSLDIHSGYYVSHVFGFVEELVVADDPEFEWSLSGAANANKSFYNHQHHPHHHHQASSISRSTSNEARQTLMYLLDAKVRRRMCKKVLDMGGNAVLAYSQNFDMEGDSGLVARTFGTAVIIEKRKRNQMLAAQGRNKNNLIWRAAGGNVSGVAPQQTATSSGGGVGVDHHDKSPHKDMGVSSRGSNTSNNIIMTLRNEAQTAAAVRQHQRQQEYAQQEVQLLTMTEFDPRVRVRFGGLVTARSVKYLGKLASKLSDQETRDGWWSELRDEIRSHARTLCCSHVIGKNVSLSL